MSKSKYQSLYGPMFTKWFAWYPVYCEGKKVWLQYVAVRWCDLGHLWPEYRWQYLPLDHDMVKRDGLR